MITELEEIKKEFGIHKELLCTSCRKRVPYQIFKRTALAVINNLEIEYEEYYGICDECQSEIYVPGLDDRNEEILEEKYIEVMHNHKTNIDNINKVE